jgi:hypothetical protein
LLLEHFIFLCPFTIICSLLLDELRNACAWIYYADFGYVSLWAQAIRRRLSILQLSAGCCHDFARISAVALTKQPEVSAMGLYC